MELPNKKKTEVIIKYKCKQHVILSINCRQLLGVQLENPRQLTFPAGWFQLQGNTWTVVGVGAINGNWMS